MRPKKRKPDLMLLSTWYGGEDPVGWMMSEKLDGVRAYWDGECLRSRAGNVFDVPDWFVADFGEDDLDGELFMGRGRFDDMSALARSDNGGERWRDVTFAIFGAPEQAGSAMTEYRIIEHWRLSVRPAYADVIRQTTCGGIDHLKVRLRQVEALGGEGLVIRRPDVPYEIGRSDTILKVKREDDGQATVIGYTHGSRPGLIAGLRVRTDGGAEFTISAGLSNAMRANPPECGTTVPYHYQGLTSGGVPRCQAYGPLPMHRKELWQ